MLSKLVYAAGLAALMSASPAFAVNYSGQEREAQQQACQADAMKLCKDDVPDEPKIIACMTQHKAELSAPCLKIFNKGGHLK